jgi:exopolysaccharide production protein ExoQ
VPPIVAAFFCCVGIIGIFWLDRDHKSRTSPALWIALAWFLLACSRSLSSWLNIRQSSVGSITDQLSEGSPMDMGVLTGLLFLGVIVLLKRGERVARILRHSAPILLFFSYCLISLVWSDYPAVAFKRWNKAIGDWVMILIVWTDPQPITALKRLLARTTYTLIPLSILFIKYYPGLGRGYGRWSGLAVYYGVTTDKNALGAICLLFGLASVWQVFNLFSDDERQNVQRSRHLIVQVVILAMILWLFSIIDAMTSLSCFLLASCLLFAIRCRMFVRSRFMVHCLVLVTVLIPVSVTLLGFSPDTLQTMGRNATLTERTDIWAMVITLVPNRWVGAGYESFWLGPRLEAMISNVTRWWVPNQSHNGYLEIFANLGWLGVGCLALVIFWGYRRAIRAWRQNLPASNLMLAYFVTGVIFNLTEAAFFRMMIPVWMFFLLAITFPQAVRNPRHENRPAGPNRVAKLEKPLSPASGEIETAKVTNSDWTGVSSITWASGCGSS